MTPVSKCVGVALLLAAAAVTSQAFATRTTLDGVYSQEQATRGEDAYNRNCARCHQADLNGTGGAPPLRTSTFTENWREGYLGNLFHHIQAWMPPQNLKGTLPEQRYLDILTYVLAANDFPAGPKDLTKADLDTILFVEAGGARELPPSSTIRAVGCLARSGSDWSLTRVGETPRVHDGSESYESELAWSRQLALGAATYRLPNADEDRKESDLVALIGRKVQVKGTLGGQAASQRINVFSLETLPADIGPQCQP